MKKSKYLAFGFSVVLALSACGGQKAPEQQEPKQEVQQVAEPVSVETPAPPIETAPEAEPEDMEPVDVQADEVEDNEAAPVEEEQAVDLFTTVNETVYATGAVNLRSGPGTTFDKVGSLSTGDSATRTGIGTGKAENWSRVMLDSGNVVYVSSSFLSLTKPVVQAGSSNVSNGSSGSTTAQQPKESAPEPEYRSREECGSDEEFLSQFSPEDRASLEAIMAERGGFGPSRQRPNADVENGGTSGSDFIYH